MREDIELTERLILRVRCGIIGGGRENRFRQNRDYREMLFLT